MNPAVARRFPLIARPRPACTPLAQRIHDLQERAALAQERHDAASATAVFNLAALLASDCGVPSLARTWCHRLAIAAIGHDHDPQHALEPIVNLARLSIRAGDGVAAWKLLETLFQAIDTRTDTVIDGIAIPAARLTQTPATYTKARTWLWTVLLGTGAHALAAAGLWDEASHRLKRYKGVGARMLDGRQITVVSHLVAGRYDQALATLSATRPGEPWEQAITTCLYLHVPARGAADRVTAALSAYQALGPAGREQVVFRTRLGLTLVDALDASQPQREQLAVKLTHDAAADGYAARELLAHPLCMSIAYDRVAGQLTRLVSDCGLDLRVMPEEHVVTLNQVLDAAEAVLTQKGRSQAPQPAGLADERGVIGEVETSPVRRGPYRDTS
ncbi:hypothetical protein GA0070216_12837 [Micromonospora matsumotoense]|uniref:Uncharacterized protein n=1 Tax=Micromonospora matsumotoense TaxID=121616 RepID=A0A1C5AUL7_9ACTN|nr:hypothetical protein [Micromonospora matsumotoense]SCF48741.1 hypothetical protein GA0070216_12837 [Micromonospora matsumotoense]